MAVIEHHGCRVLCRLSGRSYENYGAPEIFNTDQGSQFTSDSFTGVLINHGITISMDGRGRALDTIFVERLWRTVKYEEVYLKGYENMPDLLPPLCQDTCRL